MTEPVTEMLVPGGHGAAFAATAGDLIETVDLRDEPGRGGRRPEPDPRLWTRASAGPIRVRVVNRLDDL